VRVYGRSDISVPSSVCDLFLALYLNCVCDLLLSLYLNCFRTHGDGIFCVGDCRETASKTPKNKEQTLLVRVRQPAQIYLVADGSKGDGATALREYKSRGDSLLMTSININGLMVM
jgi:hypothetical protein